MADRSAAATARGHVGDDDRQPLSVGFWFSLGHSTIVFGLSFLLSLGHQGAGRPGRERQLHAALASPASIGASVSGLFLWVLGILNLAVLLGILEVFREMRRAAYDEAELEAHLDKRGLHEPLPRRPDQERAQAVAHLPDRRALRARLRHRHRGRAARARRRRGGLQPAVLRDPRAADPVRRRDVPDGHRRRRVHERGVRLGHTPSRCARSSTTSPSPASRSRSR